MANAAEVTSSQKVATTTAGLRATQWSDDALPKGTQLTAHALRTADGASVTGYLFRKGGERTVVCSMHPREMVVVSYMVPEILKGGCALWIQGPRTVGNDLRLEHETALLDLAAGQLFLRDKMNFQHCVLQGTSGGGPLAAFYCQQAALPLDQRIKFSPGGRPTGLDKAELPAADGVIFISAHLGQGKLMMNVIDPSVTDEADPFSVDKSLSAFEAANGFRKPPESSSYSAEFLSRYRAAQRARVEKIDAAAKAMVARKSEARQRLKASPNREDAILAAYAPIFQVWRTDADPRCFDLSLEAFGSCVWLALGRKPRRLELRQRRLRSRLHAGELAVELVGSLLQRRHGALRAVDQPAGPDDRIYRRQQRLSEGRGRDLCGDRQLGQDPASRARQPPRPADRRWRAERTAGRRTTHS